MTPQFGFDVDRLRRSAEQFVSNLQKKGAQPVGPSAPATPGSNDPLNPRLDAILDAIDQGKVQVLHQDPQDANIRFVEIDGEEWLLDLSEMPLGGGIQPQYKLISQDKGGEGFRYLGGGCWNPTTSQYNQTTYDSPKIVSDRVVADKIRQIFDKLKVALP
jgi:hypothetical protein